VSNVASEFLGVKTEPGVVHIIRLSEVVFIRAAGNYVDFELVGNHHLHRASLSSLMQQLPPCFIQVHRSYVINIAHLKRLQSELGRYTECVLTGERLIPLSKQFRNKLLRALSL